jgi:hypothetical protein
MKHHPENDSAVGSATPARAGREPLRRRRFRAVAAAGLAAAAIVGAIVGGAGFASHASSSQSRSVAADFGDFSLSLAGTTGGNADWGDANYGSSGSGGTVVPGS